MATLVNEGLEYRAKLTNGVSTDPFTYFILSSTTFTEGVTNTAASFTVITTGGGAKKAATCTYEASYKAKWVTTFTFTDTLTIYGIGIVNTAGKMLMSHLLPIQIIVHDTETAQITVTETEGRA